MFSKYVYIPLVCGPSIPEDIIYAIIESHLLKDDSCIYDTIDNIMQEEERLRGEPFNNTPPHDYGYYDDMVCRYIGPVHSMINGWIEERYVSQLSVVNVEFTVSGTILEFDQFY